MSRGQQVFATNCARCHSSSKPPFEAVDFRAIDSKTGLRADWLGNDVPTPVTEIGTYRCRSLHSNHMRGHVWEQFANEDYHARKTISGILEPHDGGRGYYRNVSLVNLWAHAPFLHNNSVGPELCGWGGDKSESLRAVSLQLRRYQQARQPAAGEGPTTGVLAIRSLG